MHTEHGKVVLIGQPAPDKLEIEIQTDTALWPMPGGIITSRKIVDAVECSDPTAIPRARDASVYCMCCIRLHRFMFILVFWVREEI